jgi:hypothetical protein
MCIMPCPRRLQEYQLRWLVRFCIHLHSCIEHTVQTPQTTSLPSTSCRQGLGGVLFCLFLAGLAIMIIIVPGENRNTTAGSLG